MSSTMMMTMFGRGGVSAANAVQPIVSAANVRRMAALSGARIPEELARDLERVADDDKATRELGVRWATEQCEGLLAGGVPGIHFYTLNKSPATRRIFDSLFRK